MGLTEQWIPVEYFTGWTATGRVPPGTLPPLPKGAIGWRVYSGETVIAEVRAPPRTIRGRILHWWRWHLADLRWR